MRKLQLEHRQVLIAGVLCLALIGCESPPVVIKATTGTWTGNSYAVLLMGEKHSSREIPKPAEAGQILVQKSNRGETVGYFYLTRATTLEWGKQLTSKPPVSRADYEPGQIGHLDAMVVLVDQSGYPLDPTPYNSRKLRVTGRLTAGGPKCPINGSQLHANCDSKLPFQVMVWSLATTPEQIEDLGPKDPKAEPYFPPSIRNPALNGTPSLLSVKPTCDSCNPLGQPRWWATPWCSVCPVALFR